ncbi:hypothetical protein CEXT_409441 [Caerostris extrusa]|uniref:Uncharacterized protein n=1 Tax=Caerostris extrusa TaxID=172846 RepID=A0AAV4Y276_CAEEX|nr:hypothetical protein CEXT_409441 [Caerostris extrusa]
MYYQSDNIFLLLDFFPGLLKSPPLNACNRSWKIDYHYIFRSSDTLQCIRFLPQGEAFLFHRNCIGTFKNADSKTIALETYDSEPFGVVWIP